MVGTFKKGDKVSCDTPQGETHGEAETNLMGSTDIKGHHVAASKDNPEYLVKSGKSGKEAAHKPDELKADK